MTSDPGGGGGTCSEELGNDRSRRLTLITGWPGKSRVHRYLDPMASVTYTFKRHDLLQVPLTCSTWLGGIDRCLQVPAAWSPLEFPKCV